MISVLILTLNEEKNIKRCLDSVAWSDDIVVLDSGSTDKTVEIAKKAGARIFYRSFDNERNQREFSLRNIQYRYSWVYNPDADEETPLDLADEMRKKIKFSADNVFAYRMRFKTYFLGRWIKYSSLYPTWVVRLFQPEKISFDRSINLSYAVNGNTGMIDAHFIHHTFNNGFDSWFNKHNFYSKYEALESLKILSENKPLLRILLKASSNVDRRAALKNLSVKLPFRPLLRFLYMYFLRCGFLDGRPGFHYCLLLSIYEYMITLKVLEFKRRKKNLLI
jgi:glycosyltransferase involved in cell wall biosynthesis